MFNVHIIDLLARFICLKLGTKFKIKDIFSELKKFLGFFNPNTKHIRIQISEAKQIERSTRTFMDKTDKIIVLV